MTYKLTVKKLQTQYSYWQIIRRRPEMGTISLLWMVTSSTAIKCGNVIKKNKF